MKHKPPTIGSRWMAALLLLPLLFAACSGRPASPRMDTGSPAPVFTSTSTPAPLTATASSTPAPPTSTSTSTALPTATLTPTLTPTRKPTATPTASFVPTSVAGIKASKIQMDKGWKLYKARKFQEAAAAFEEAIRLFPWTAEAYIGLYNSQIGSKGSEQIALLDDKIRESDQAIKNNPKDAWAYFTRGKLKYVRILAAGEPAEEEPVYKPGGNVTIIGEPPVYRHLILKSAIKDLDRAILLDPTSAQAYHMRGLARHLEALTYVDISLARINPDGISKAIQDYETAISLDPDLEIAYNDKGAALAQHALLSEDELTMKERIKELDEAIGEFSKAIEIDPQWTDAYLNRAYAALVTVIIAEDQNPERLARSQHLVAYADEVIDMDPQNLWGYLLRLTGYAVQQGLEKDKAIREKLITQAEEDYQKYLEMRDPWVASHEQSLVTRILTLSTGPDIVPANQGINNITGQVYTNPDGSFTLKVPKLMQPNAVMSAIESSSGELMVLFSDDVGRTFMLQSHPGSTGRQTLEQWVQDNLTIHLGSGDARKLNIKNDPAVQFSYQDAGLKARCEMIVLAHNQRIYTTSYCLKDIETGDPYEYYRLSAPMYGIAYEPVDDLLLEFIRGLKFNSIR